MTSWDFAREIWDRHAQPLRDLGLAIERVDQATYWSTFETMRAEHFPPEVFFRLRSLRSPEAQAMQAKVAVARGGTPLYDFTFLRAGGELAAVFCGHERDGDYRMWHTVVHQGHRRKGIYRAILATTIGYTRELGFDRIISEHAPGNNPVIIAKLAAGFRIVALEIEPAVGPSVILHYFHNPEHFAAYELRCGMATLTPGLRGAGFGAFEQLRAQFRGGDDT